MFTNVSNCFETLEFTTDSSKIPPIREQSLLERVIRITPALLSFHQSSQSIPVAFGISTAFQFKDIVV